MNSILSAPYFHNEEAAYEYVEARLWPHGPTCPKCGVIGNSAKLKGKSTRIGVYKCRDCRKPFTVKVGTIFEASHIPMNVWLQAIFLVASSKKGMSSNQLHRSLGITLKSAWFMSHRIREAMRGGALAPFGANGGVVEIDETYIGRNHRVERPRGAHHKHKVLALVDRTSGQALSVVVDEVKAASLLPIIRANVAKEARIMTDKADYYNDLRFFFKSHDSVNHTIGEYVSQREPGNPYQHHRRLLLCVQAWDEGRLPALRAQSPASVRGRV
jgi:transposase-like protein